MQMVDKKLFSPVTIDGWMVIVYERQQRFRQQNADEMIQGLLDSFREVGSYLSVMELRKCRLTLS